MSAFIKFTFLALCLLIGAVSPAIAQNYYNQITAPPAAEDKADAPVSRTVIVTSIEKCYTQLGSEAALEIQRNFIKPYEECKRRLALKTQQQNSAKAGEQKKNVTPPPKDGTAAAPDSASTTETPAVPRLSEQGLYYRVQKNTLPQYRAAEENPAPATGWKKPSRNKSYDSLNR